MVEHVVVFRVMLYLVFDFGRSCSWSLTGKHVFFKLSVEVMCCSHRLDLMIGFSVAARPLFRAMRREVLHSTGEVAKPKL